MTAKKINQEALIRFAVNTLALELTTYIIKEIHIDNLLTLIIASIVIGLLNSIIKPTIIILTLPINLITLGGFTFIINAFLLYTASFLVPGFKIDTFFHGILGALCISFISFLLNTLIKKGGEY